MPILFLMQGYYPIHTGAPSSDFSRVKIGDSICIILADFLDGHVDCGNFVDSILTFLTQWLPLYQRSQRTYVTVAVGCTGGQHRSVYVAEKLFAALKPLYAKAQIRHRELSPELMQ